MVNYYKILGIENYAGIALVKKAYKDKIREFHPDLNPSEDAVEISKYLNQAKEILTNEDKKNLYDHDLKLAYLVEIQRLQNKSEFASPFWQKRRQQREEQEKMREKERYERGLKHFPFYLRLFLLLTIMFTGLQLIYHHYFVMYDGLELLYSLLGFGLFVSSGIILSNQVFTRYWVMSLNRVIPFDYEKWIAWALVCVLISGPASIFGLNEYKRAFQLQNNFEYTIADLDKTAAMKGELVYTYEVEGKKYAKRIKDANSSFIMLEDYKILIKYSKSNPKIVSPVSDRTELKNYKD